MGALSPLLRPFGTRLWSPGQVKQQGFPKIKWQHPLVLGITNYWFDPGTGVPIDLVTGEVMVKDATGTIPTVAASAYGCAAKYSGTNSMVSSRAVSPTNMAAPFTFAYGFFHSAANTLNAQLFARGDTAGVEGNGFFAIATTGVGLAVGNAGSGAGTFTPVVGSFNVVVGVATGASAQSFYGNGKLVGTGASTSAFTPAQTDLWGFNVARIGMTQTAFFGAFWTRALSASDAVLLFTDPYCFLVPLEPEMMIIQSAAVADVLDAQIWL